MYYVPHVLAAGHPSVHKKVLAVTALHSLLGGTGRCTQQLVQLGPEARGLGLGIIAALMCCSCCLLLGLSTILAPTVNSLCMFRIFNVL